MKITRIAVLAVIAFGAYKVFGPAEALWNSEPKPYEITEFTFDGSNGGSNGGSTGKVRDRMYLEKGIMAGATHRLDFLLPDGSWKEVFSFRFDDPASAKDQNVKVKRLSNGSLAVIAGWVLALSSDQGSTWTIWDAGKDLKGWQCCNYKLIQDIDIDSTGNGIMNVSVIAQERRERPLFRTRDGGHTWID